MRRIILKIGSGWRCWLSFAPDTEAVNETIRWAIITTTIGIILVVLYGTRAAIAFLGPHERDPAPSVVDIGNSHFLYRIAQTGAPPAVRLSFTPHADLYGCGTGRFWPRGVPMTEHFLDQSFHNLELQMDLDVGVTCNQHFTANEPNTLTIDPQYPLLTDNVIQSVQQGVALLYTFVVFKYAPDSSPDKWYYREYCFYYSGDLSTERPCPGNHNGTFHHLVK